jgi:hypothetical protein
MFNPTDYPLLVFVVSLALLWGSCRVGTTVLRRHRDLDEGDREDFGTILAATLTLLGLIIGFTFSMAVSRYDQRKNLEEEEANAIGTEYVRADLLPAADAAKVRRLLVDYTQQRIRFYVTRDEGELAAVDKRREDLQNALWAAVAVPAAAQPTPIMALVTSGMNDVLNAQGYTQAAWWNRIPLAAWILMLAIAVCGNLLLGYGGRHSSRARVLQSVLPLVLSIAFFLIADIDSPRGGVIRVGPHNLQSLAASLHAP